MDNVQKHFNLSDTSKLPPVGKCIIHDGYDHIHISQEFMPVNDIVYKHNGCYYFEGENEIFWRWLQGALYIIWK